MDIVPLYLLELLLLVAFLLLSIKMRRLGMLCAMQKEQQREEVRPHVAIIVAVRGQMQDLSETLPLYLQQSYEGAYEVIVVNERDNDGFTDFIERLEAQHTNLIHTSVPTSARDVSLRRLSYTLGVRATDAEWVVFTHADVKPNSALWLDALMRSCTPEVDAVVPFARYTDAETNERYAFFRLWQQLLWMPHALSHKPYRSDESCLCYRREHFISHNGFAQSANLKGGEHTLLVNHHVQKGRCAVNLLPEATVCEEIPTQHQWHVMRMFFTDTQHHMKRGLLYQTHYVLQAITPLMFVLYSLGLIAYHAANTYVSLPMAVLLLACIVFRTNIIVRTAKLFDVHLSAFAVPFMELLIPVCDASAWLRWKCADKKTFRKKFV